MRLSDKGMTLALATAAALIVLAPAAFAGNGHGHGNGHAYGHRGNYRVVYRPQRVYYAPQRVVYAPPPVVYAPQACEPRYVTYRPSHVVIVRPTPYVRIGGQFGPVSISAIFGPRRYASQYEYGCNFCDAHFSSFGGYENHVEHCGYRPANVRLDVRAWDEQGATSYNQDDQDDRYDGR